MAGDGLWEETKRRGRERRREGRAGDQGAGDHQVTGETMRGWPAQVLAARYFEYCPVWRSTYPYVPEGSEVLLSWVHQMAWCG